MGEIILREPLSGFFCAMHTKKKKKKTVLIFTVFFLWKWGILFELKFPGFQSEEKQSVQVVEYANIPVVTNIISIFLEQWKKSLWSIFSSSFPPD